MIRLLLICLLINGCSREERFDNLGDKVAKPVAIDKLESGSGYFYVLNGDLHRFYNTGSIMVIDASGKKVKVISVPRMGSFLKVIRNVHGKNWLVVGFAGVEPDEPRFITLYTLDDPKNPKKVREFTLDCDPNAIGATDGYEHFAITCSDNGRLAIGTLAPDPDDATLNKVRRYNWNRHALYIDPVREVLFAFVTDIGEPEFQDKIEKDVTGYDEDGIQILDEDGNKLPNEKPDNYENTRAARASRSEPRKYQVVVYDIAVEREKDFPDILDFFSEDIESEYRFLHFNVQNFDGTPDVLLSADKKYYRTNFWDAVPDPDNTGQFYLSQRGLPSSKLRHANHVLKVSMVGDPTPDDGTVPPIEDYLRFERVYGFRGEQTTSLHYPGDIDVTRIDGQKMVLVNHFRDLDKWKADEVFFGISAQLLDGSLWFDEINTKDLPSADVADKSWYQISALSDGTALSAHFQSDALILLDVRPGIGITELKRIE